LELAASPNVSRVRPVFSVGLLEVKGHLPIHFKKVKAILYVCIGDVEGSTMLHKESETQKQQGHPA